MTNSNAIYFVFAAAIFLSAGCDRKLDPPSLEEQEAILADAPQPFVNDGDRLALAGIEELHLGQAGDEARERLGRLCPKTMEYRNGSEGDKAWFRGCIFSDPEGPNVSVRVGFWEKLDGRVATLETKRTDTTTAQVRERFRQLADARGEELIVDLPREGILEMRTPKHQVMADIDDGAQGPTHITLGYAPSWAEENGS